VESVTFAKQYSISFGYGRNKTVDHYETQIQRIHTYGWSIVNHNLSLNTAPYIAKQMEYK
jgi:hypothetical protein